MVSYRRRKRSSVSPRLVCLVWLVVTTITLRCGLLYTDLPAVAAAETIPWGGTHASSASMAGGAAQCRRRDHDPRRHPGTNRNHRRNMQSCRRKRNSRQVLGKSRTLTTAWILPPSTITLADAAAAARLVVGGTAAATSGSLASDPASLWLLRGASALLTYAGCVAYWDRPRGGENILPPPGATTTTLDRPSKSCLRVAPSSVTGAGLGLFVTQRLDRGTRLGFYPGVVLPLATHVPKLQTAPPCEAYIWRFSDDQMVIDPTNEQGDLEPTCRGGNPSTLGSTVLFATLLALWQVPTTLCRINEPPLGRDVNVITVEDLSQRQVALVLERDVYPGEELFMDYGRDYDRSRYVKTPTTAERDAVDSSLLL